jgi:ABC-type transport system involved in multi-copper enzyme maturation permease subunit
VFLLIALVMSQFFNSAPDVVVFSVLCGAAGIYTVAGFWLAHRLFHRAQDVAWTGGIISFSKWRYYDAGAGGSVSVRRWRPLAALLKKEFQLNSITVIGFGALLVLHFGVFFLRSFYSNFHRNSLSDVISEMFWVLWLVMPVILGCLAVAEERKLGVTEAQFCLPVSRHLQFAGKFIPVMLFGVLLGGVMPLLLETLAGHFGGSNDYFQPENHQTNGFGIPDMVWFEGTILLLSAGLAFVGFFASTLAWNFLQALSIAIVIIVGCCLFIVFILSGQSNENGQFALWGAKNLGIVLPLVFGLLTASVVAPWLAYRNFSHFVEGGRLWRRNIFTVVGAVLFIFTSSAVIYNRAWEIFQPAEPPHGPAIFSAANAPVLHSDTYSGLRVRFPDGRIWFNSLGYPFFNKFSRGIWSDFWWMLLHPLPASAGPEQFMAGSNWVSATTRHIEFWIAPGSSQRRVNGYLDTVGVQPDGTLWISSEAKPVDWTGAKMIRYGDETNWQQVIRSQIGLLLLKRDGTLWQWGTNRLDWYWQSRWPTVRVFQPQQLGTNSDWQEIFNDKSLGFARKKDGSVWRVNWDWQIEPATNFDQVVTATFSDSGNASSAYVGKGGTLWACNLFWENARNKAGLGFQPASPETNWVAVALSWNWIVALKADGSLWQWRFSKNSPVEIAKIPPARLGIHNDWVGLTGTWDGAVALAADGSLWFWPNPENSNGALLKAPRQPQLLGKVFGKSD